jgi:membrane protein implicated in regulation of membrane protease activity
MPIRTYVNGREVHSPAARMLVMAIVMFIAAILLSVLFFVILPLAGLAIGAGLGVAAIGGGSALLGLVARRRFGAGRKQLGATENDRRDDRFLNP